VKVGDLVKTNRESVGIPEGALGLIVSIRNLGWSDRLAYDVDLFKPDQYGLRQYIYFKEDLEVISESR
jgi:hypothetical protein